ncbi:MAG: hypothetical protein LBV77_01090 [Candidatus Adiutrix intracellularis]|nr:hypothetical protein [Candidatus Adiutrix intracellularis]
MSLNNLIKKTQVGETKPNYLSSINHRSGKNQLTTRPMETFNLLDYLINFKILLPRDNSLSRNLNNDVIARLIPASFILLHRQIEQQELD